MKCLRKIYRVFFSCTFTGYPFCGRLFKHSDVFKLHTGKDNRKELKIKFIKLTESIYTIQGRNPTSIDSSWIDKTDCPPCKILYVMYHFKLPQHCERNPETRFLLVTRLGRTDDNGVRTVEWIREKIRCFMFRNIAVAAF